MFPIKLQGRAEVVFNYLAMLNITREKDIKTSPGWWQCRANIIASDKAREPNLNLGEKLLRRMN